MQHLIQVFLALTLAVLGTLAVPVPESRSSIPVSATALSDLRPQQQYWYYSAHNNNARASSILFVERVDGVRCTGTSMQMYGFDARPSQPFRVHKSNFPSFKPDPRISIMAPQFECLNVGRA
ncbi:hypothetical protein FB451DRAFT_1413982 [Mycena latifolia]|nr:hypothetical protein FB451DRAFT_1413982 [Mycena latifolia]